VLKRPADLVHGLPGRDTREGGDLVIVKGRELTRIAVMTWSR
jgi:hypothetical protein